MDEPGTIRRRDDGTFEYLRSQSLSIRQGLVEQWESAVEHAAKNMQMPAPFLANLRSAGYRGGTTLFDLMIAEGWKRPEREYIEIVARSTDLPAEKLIGRPTLHLDEP